MTAQEIRSRIMVDQRWLEHAILAIDTRQTSDEQNGDVTIYDNGRGWNRADARNGGYLARYIRDSRRPSGQRLSGRFVANARRMIVKYCGQLARVVAAKAQAA